MRLSEAHTDAAFFGLIRETRDPGVVARFTVDGEPVSKARARFTKGGRSYTPETTRAAEELVAWKFRSATKARPDKDASFGVVCLFFSATHQRRDVDNMIKLVLDGLNGVAWVDDSQVVEVSGRKDFVLYADHARTEVVVYRLGQVNVPTAQCEHCGEEYHWYPSQRARKFCSRECFNLSLAAARKRTCEGCGKEFVGSPGRKFCSIPCRAHGMRVSLTCEHCGKVFTKPKSLMRNGRPFCSELCRVTYWREHRTDNAKGTCATCGGPTSKKTYTNCRACMYRKDATPTPAHRGSVVR